MKKFDQNEFVTDLLGVDWRGIVRNSDDINVVVNNWTKIVSLIREKHAPTRNRRVYDKSCSWLTNDFKHMCKARNKLKNKLFVTFHFFSFSFNIIHTQKKPFSKSKYTISNYNDKTLRIKT